MCDVESSLAVELRARTQRVTSGYAAAQHTISLIINECRATADMGNSSCTYSVKKLETPWVVKRITDGPEDERLTVKIHDYNLVWDELTISW